MQGALATSMPMCTNLAKVMSGNRNGMKELAMAKKEVEDEFD